MNKCIVIVFLIIIQVYSLKLKVFFDGGCKMREKNLSGGAAIAYKYKYECNNYDNEYNNYDKVFQCQYCYGNELHYNSHVIEYLSLINAIQAIKYYISNDNDIDNIELLGDSAIVINHIKNKYDRKKDFYLQQYHSLASSLLDSVNTKLELKHIPRENNTLADTLANKGMNELTSVSSLAKIYQGSLFIMKVIDPINNEQIFRSIYNSMNLEIVACGIKTTLVPNDIDSDNLRVIDVISAQNCSSINIKSNNNESIDIPLNELKPIIKFPVNITTKHFGIVSPISISMLHVSFTNNESILKAVINLISSPKTQSEQSFTYIFSSLLHSIQRRNLLSVLGTKVLVQVTTTNDNNRRFCSIIEDNSDQINSNQKLYLATPLQISLLLGNVKSTELLLSIAGKNVLDDSIDNDAVSISDEEAAEIGKNVKNKKLMKEFIMKTIK